MTNQIEVVKAAGYRDGQPVNDKEYKVLNGTFYDGRTPDKVCIILDELRQNRNTVKIHLGDTATGRDWNEEHDTIGHVGRSTGDIKIPLLVNTRSYGGPGLLDHCIVKIRTIGKHPRTLYQVDNYQAPAIEITDNSDLPEYSNNLLIDGQIYSRHKTRRAAQLLKTKLS